MRLNLKDKQVLVLGLGDTGLSALRWLAGQGAVLSVADTRDNAPNIALVQKELPQASVHLGPFTAQVLNQADIIVASPGVAVYGTQAEPQIQAAIRRGIPVIGDVELFAQYKSPQARVIAITGANGKSTVTMMIGTMCQAAGLTTVVAGNIGLPVLEAMTAEAPDIYVLELSSFQLETTSTLQADAATVLNISEDHMDRYASLQDYAAAKARIFNGTGVQVLNRQDAWSSGMALSGRSVVSFGIDLPPGPDDFGLLHEQNDIWLMQGTSKLIKASEMPVAGLHNACNALAALALCRALGFEYAPMLAALRNFKGLPHRVEWVAEIADVAFYDDSKGTNVGATCAALAGLASDNNKVVLIAGGDGKGQDFSPLREAVAQNARAVVLIGRDAPQISAVLADTGIPLMQAADMQQAVQVAAELAQPHDVVLLSPACASFDMYRNYVHRAEVFVEAVHALAAASHAGSGASSRMIAQ